MIDRVTHATDVQFFKKSTKFCDFKCSNYVPHVSDKDQAIVVVTWSTCRANALGTVRIDDFRTTTPSDYMT